MDPIEVQGPDGQRYQFPAGTSPDVMKQAMAKRYPKPEAQPQPDTLTDVAKSTGTGLVQGAAGVAGLPTDIDTGIDAAVGWAMRKLGASDEQIPKDTHAFTNALLPGMGLLRQFAPEQVRSQLSAPGTQQIVKGIEENVTGPLYQPQTTAGKYARTVAEFAPGVLAGPGGLGRRALQTTTSALGSEAAGQAAEGTGYEPYARIAGAIAGGLAPTAGERLVTPNPITPERQAMVDTLMQEGVRPTAGQATGRKGLQYFESELGGRATERALENQADQFTAAALRRVGTTADRATPDVVDAAFTRIGQQFDDLASRNTLAADPQLGQDIGNVVREYAAMVPPSQQAPIIGNMVTDIIGRVQGGQGSIPGRTYQSWRSRLNRGARSTNDPQLKQALFGFQNALDGAMERSINPADAAAWRQARDQYKNLLVVEKAATGAGEAAGMGAISPARLRQAAVGQNRRAYVRGQNDFSELAHAGQSILTPLPNSGTASRAAARLGPAALGAGLVGGPTAALGAIGGALAPKIAGRAAMSRPVQAYLRNQLMAEGMSARKATQRAALLEVLMGPRLFAPSLPPPDQVR